MHPVEDIMQKNVLPGEHVLVLDEGGHWRGCGTAWYLVERGHRVTLVTPKPVVGSELARTSADFPLRSLLLRSGAHFYTESVLESWDGAGGLIKSLLSGETCEIEADALVMATTNVAFDMLALELDQLDLKYHEIGDCVAPRLAPFSFYEGRKLGLSL